MEEDTKRVTNVIHLSPEQKESWFIKAKRKIREVFLHFMGWPTEKDVQDELLINNKGKGL